ncbi:MAG: hypothetical protein FWE21_00360 [Defluviitaleaceae bacterium]|nr:hypothetical protein [Defluviitaleaceae bacterium]
MTRKQALQAALDVVTDQGTKEKIQEILDHMPFMGWSEQTIFDTINQFIIDNGRPPRTAEFKKKTLPPHTVIKLRFGINLKDFLEKHYPQNQPSPSRPYSHQTKEHWQAQFIDDYIKNRPPSARQHNAVRTQGTPSWQTISTMFGIQKWRDWLKHCNLTAAKGTQINLTTHDDLIKKLSNPSCPQI